MKYSLHNNWKLLSSIIVILSVFLFLRLYSITTSLVFYNDMGRDFVVLNNWFTTGKPPLLGPQTSAFSYNQSAWYFYLLFPFYFVTQSPYSSLISLICITVCIFLYLLYINRHAPRMTRILLIVFWLISIQPQAVIQSRFVWNPSFLPAFFIGALILFLHLLEKFSKLKYFLFVSLLAFDCGFSYSAVTAAAIIWLAHLGISRGNWKEIIILSIVASGVVLAPMLFFELRHNFTLTQLALHGQTMPQPATDFFSKTRDLTVNILFTPYPQLRSLIAILVFTVLGAGCWQLYKDRTKDSSSALIIIGLFFSTILLTYLLPIAIQSHYIFPLLILFFFAVAVLPTKYWLSIVLLLSILWLDPKTVIPYFKSAPRTISQMEACYQQYCRTHTEPVYVSMESGILGGYHNAPEHRFLLSRAGCTVYDIEVTQNRSNKMVVINDSAQFVPGMSAYHELTLFGEYTVGQKYSCQDNLSIQEIYKPTAASTSAKIFKP